MAVTREDVGRVARLAKLSLSDEESEALRRELGEILDYVEKLRGLELSDVDPIFAARRAGNVLRDDEEGPMLARREALAGAPSSDGRHFRVPGFLPES